MLVWDYHDAADGLELLRSPEWVEVAKGSVVVKTMLPRESVELMRLSW